MWMCDVCGLKSQPASTQCDVCEAPRPAGSVSDKNKSTVASSSGQGFTGWGSVVKSAPNPAATSGGGQATTSDAEWTCDVCMLKSKPTSTQCDVCETPRPGVKPSSSAPAATTNPAAAPSPTPLVKGFTGWGSSAFAQPKPVAEGEWTCGVCSCKSKATSTQCDVCETPRS